MQEAGQFDYPENCVVHKRFYQSSHGFCEAMLLVFVGGISTTVLLRKVTFCMGANATVRIDSWPINFLTQICCVIRQNSLINCSC